MGKTLNQFMSLAMVVVGVLFLVYIMKNPNAKNFFTSLINQFKGIGGSTQPVQAPITPAPAPAPAPSQNVPSLSRGIIPAAAPPPGDPGDNGPNYDPAAKERQLLEKERRLAAMEPETAGLARIMIA
jgi:hypothetical protein